jgi:methyl-accepting chemotaxis protein
MKNIPIVGKLMAVIAVFGIFIIGVAVYSTGQMKTIDNSYTDLGLHNYRVAVAIARANRNLNAAQAAIGELLISTDDAGNAKAMARLKEAREKFKNYMDAAITNAPAADKADLETLKNQGNDVLDAGCAQAIREGAAATGSAAVLASQKTFLETCAPKFPPLVDAMTAKTGVIEKAAQDKDDELSRVTSSSILTTYGVIIGGLVGVLVLAFFCTRAWITGPLNLLNSTMARLAGGDLTAVVHGDDRKDEVGSMARTVQVFKDAGLEKVRLEKEAADQRAAAEAERKLNEEQRAHAAEQQALVVESVASGLSNLAGGNLMFRLNTPFAPEYEKLRNDFNDAMAKLQDTMKVISVNTQGIRGGGEEISQASDDLSRRTEQQAASLEETAAALDEITATVRKTAEGAKEASTVVGAAKTDAEHSGEVVRQAVQAMSAIENSSAQIGNIISVIDEIAFQTNLLALNAGVEAARAGDAGRGFAVVASEVRALAQRSADAAKEIKALISASSQQVTSGVALVDETGNALERIVKQVAQINTLVNDIAASAQEQATGLTQVNTAVNQMDQVTQQNAAMVEQSTAASHSLAQEVEELSRLLSQFQVGEQPSNVARLSKKRPAPAPSPSPVHAARAKIAAFAGGGRTSGGGEEASDSWEEF